MTSEFGDDSFNSKHETLFDEIPDTYECPVCETSKSENVLVKI